MKVAHTLDAEWKFAAGDVFGVFHALLREGRMAALRCSGCGAVYLPPRPACGDCFAPLADWVQVAETGTVEAFTVAQHAIVDPVTGGKRRTPAGLALVKLDGASTPMQGWVVEDDLSRLAIGRRVRMVWKDPRRTMADLLGFAYSDEPPDARFPRAIDCVPTPARETFPVKIPLEFRYDAGRAGDWFLRGLAERRILASRCDRCARTLVPCRSFCPTCFRPLDQDAVREVGPVGAIAAAAGVGAAAHCLVRLDGADNLFLHRLLADASAGARVRARFSEQPTGGLLDIVGFAP